MLWPEMPKPSDLSKVVYRKIILSEINIEKDTAYDCGYYEGDSKYTDGRTTKWKGKYVIVFEKVKGDWKIYLDIWNSVKEQFLLFLNQFHYGNYMNKNG